MNSDTRFLDSVLNEFRNRYTSVEDVIQGIKESAEQAEKNVIKILSAFPFYEISRTETEYILEKTVKNIADGLSKDVDEAKLRELIEAVLMLLFAEHVKQMLQEAISTLNKQFTSHKDKYYQLPYDVETTTELLTTLITYYGNGRKASADLLTLTYIHYLAKELNVKPLDVAQYVHTLILMTKYFQDEVRAIPVVKKFIKEKYGIDFDDYLGAKLIKVEQFPWDLEFHIPEVALVLVEVGKHTLKVIEDKIRKVNEYITANPKLIVDFDESRVAGREIEYPEVIWLHVNSVNLEIDRVVTIKAKTSN
ncbi:hypothetical protein Pdsh_03090 [Pyrodictium delaneyi]|uniref:Uncharacterized protein n=1 Tax=Pyrodictium delaneyi TaxID=1273541 RepID=A0A211YNV8_9CREN|nr:hypothetical protein Pdsh_03090 [Pyrodictium delaneyi]